MKSKKSAAFSFFLIIIAFIPIMIIILGRERDESGPAPGRNFALIEPGETLEAIVAKAARIAPSARQWDWQSREYIAFAHFGMNTFTDREWGEGEREPKVFNPTDFDARQWVRVVKDAGMKTLIVTAKHHDGFCLWPTAQTTHSVKSSPWREGNGDVVGDVAAACREAGIGFGVYLSPWDRHEPSFGDSARYNEFFLKQLREVLTGNGPVAEVWFDGANGEGPNGKKQEYDWPSYYRLIRELQPNAVIAIMGPDVRWVGTESGYGRETEWSVIPVSVPDRAAVRARGGENAMDGAFSPQDRMGDDLGSRDRLASAEALIWYPAETDVSIRPGWFYHQAQDGEVKPPEKLLEIYESSVGRNGVLLLNIPPDKRGRIPENDERSLLGLRRLLDEIYGKNLASGAAARASGSAAGCGPENILDESLDTFWSAPEGMETGEIVFELPAPAEFDRLDLREYIRAGQRIEAFSLDIDVAGQWKNIARGTTVGARRIVTFPLASAGKIRLSIERSRTSPTVASFGLYRSPQEGDAR